MSLLLSFGPKWAGLDLGYLAQIGYAYNHILDLYGPNLCLLGLNMFGLY